MSPAAIQITDEMELRTLLSGVHLRCMTAKRGTKAAPKRQPRAQPAAQGRPRKGPSRRPAAPAMKGIPNWLDPSSTMEPPLEKSYGKGNFLQIKEKLTVTTSTSNYTGLILSNDGVSGTFGIMLDQTPTTMQTTSQAGIGDASATGNVSAMKAARLAVTLRNTTQALNVGGEVFVWLPSNRFDTTDLYSGTVALQNAAMAALLNRPDSRTWTAQDFTSSKKFVSYPVTEDYDQFKAPIGTSIAQNDWDEHFGFLTTGEATSARALHNRPMAPIVLIFPPTSAANTYSVTVHLAWWLRYGIGSAGHYYSRMIPTVQTSILNRVRDFAERHATGETQRALPANKVSVVPTSITNNLPGSKNLVTRGLEYVAKNYGSQIASKGMEMALRAALSGGSPTPGPAMLMDHVLEVD